MTSPPTVPKAPPVAESVNLDICQAILAAQDNFGPLVKDASNAYLKSSYMPLSTLLKAIREPLADQGVIATHSYEQRDNAFVVVTALEHPASGTRITSSFPVLSMENPQKVGACGTYAMRYNLMLLLNIAASDDDGAATSPQQFTPPVTSGVERTAPQHVPSPSQPESWL